MYPITKRVTSVIVHRASNDLRSSGITFKYADATFTQIGDVDGNEAQYETVIPESKSLIGFKCQFNQSPVGAVP